MKIVSASLLLLASMASVVVAQGSLRSTTSNSPKAHRELFFGKIVDAVGNAVDNAGGIVDTVGDHINNAVGEANGIVDAVGDAVNNARDAVGDAMESVFAKLMPVLTDRLGSAFIEELGNHMDPFPFSGHNTRTYAMLGNCTDDGAVAITINEITGLSSLKFDRMTMKTMPTFKATNFKIKWDGGNFEIQANIGRLQVNSTYALTSSDCGMEVDESMTGIVEITGVKLSFNLDIDGFSKYNGQTKITDFEVKDFAFDTSEAAISGDTAIATTVSTPDGDVQVNADITDSIESFVDEELEGTLKDVSLTLINDLADGFLPMVIDSGAFTV
ncbi:expressed unknown protein [Seminavis robusta]|uniref:Uncharacterized protein n=1 Tax=Seminavis robusta TaxID=568900 RepID=A0A9N8EIY0_9STRA|nr:expressed unknown protein [Seminavis robusta]|eukprot:Sro1009_g230720.1 n/a (329) ;mRNA; f:28340-29326